MGCSWATMHRDLVFLRELGGYIWNDVSGYNVTIYSTTFVICKQNWYFSFFYNDQYCSFVVVVIIIIIALLIFISLLNITPTRACSLKVLKSALNDQHSCQNLEN